MRRLLVLVVASALVSLVLVSGVGCGGSGDASRSAGRARWEIRDLGTLGGKESHAGSINAFGQIVGQSTTVRGDQHAFVWQGGRMWDLGSFLPLVITDRGLIVGTTSPAAGRSHVVWRQKGHLTDLGALAAGSSVYAINGRGQIVGTRIVGSVRALAFLWRQGRTTDIATLCRHICTVYGIDINDRGQIVATRSDTTGAFLWQGGKTTDLVAGEYDTSVAVAINERGQIVGNYAECAGGAFLWEKGRTTDLGTLGRGCCRANAINERGQIIGITGAPPDPGIEYPLKRTRAFLWQNGKMTDLGTLGGERSDPTAINESGQIIGSSWIKTRDSHAFVWENGTMTDLGTLGGNASYASAINERGQIVGTSQTKSGQTHAVLWTLRSG